MANEALWGEEWSGSSANWDADWGEPAFALGAVSLALSGSATLTGTITFPSGFALGNLSLAMTGTPGMAGDPGASLSDFDLDAPAELPLVGHLGVAGALEYYGGALFSLGTVSLDLTGYSGVVGALGREIGVNLGALTLPLGGHTGLQAGLLVPFALGNLTLDMSGALTVAGEPYIAWELGAVSLALAGTLRTDFAVVYVKNPDILPDDVFGGWTPTAQPAGTWTSESPVDRTDNETD